MSPDPPSVLAPSALGPAYYCRTNSELLPQGLDRLLFLHATLTISYNYNATRMFSQTLLNLSNFMSSLLSRVSLVDKIN